MFSVLVTTLQYNGFFQPDTFSFILLTIIALVDIVFANGLEDQSSIPVWVISKTQKMILDTLLFDTQHYKVFIKGKVEQSRERSSALPYTSV